MVFLGYAKAKVGQATIKAEGALGQNMYDLLSLGGYAVSEIDPTTGEYTYTNYSTLSFWTDISMGKTIEKGVFIGLTKNQGTSEEIAGPIYARGSNIDQIFRVAPRVQVNSGKVRYAFEVDWTSAAYGTADSKGVVQDAEAVANIRALFAMYYFF